MDCCAAPGNKTTHVAALMGGRGRVLAFDMDPVRLKRLQVRGAGGGWVMRSCAVSCHGCGDDVVVIWGLMWHSFMWW